MASYTKTEIMPEAESGDTYEGVEFTLTVNGSAKNLTSAAIVMTINTQGTLTTEDSGGLTITDAGNGVFTVDQQVISYEAGNHNYKIVFTFSDGSVKNYIDGTWRIT